MGLIGLASDTLLLGGDSGNADSTCLRSGGEWPTQLKRWVKFLRLITIGKLQVQPLE